MSGRPRVLFFTSRFLCPEDSGGRIRTASLLRALRRLWGVTLVSGFDPDTDTPYHKDAEALAERLVAVARPRSAAPSFLSLQLRRLRRAASLAPRSVQYETDPVLREALGRELASGVYDLFVCDFLQATANVPEPCPCPSLLFTHNVESRITRRHAELAAGPARKVLWLWQHALTLLYEERALGRYDRVVAVSESDRQEFAERFGVTGARAVPTGVDTERFRPTGRDPEPDHIVFCGSMDWTPNQDAARWFVANVLPRIAHQRPAARLTIVGRHPPADLLAAMGADDRVRLTGRVEDVRPWLERAACVVVPLRIGGGTRIKIYEALALERPVVSTSIGAEGLPIEDGRHYLRADGAEAFADKVLECLERPRAARAMAAEARRYVALHFGWDRVADAFAAVGAEAIEARRRLGP